MSVLSILKSNLILPVICFTLFHYLRINDDTFFEIRYNVNNLIILFPTFLTEKACRHKHYVTEIQIYYDSKK